MFKQKIIISDLLSFMVSKIKLTTRNKLLKVIESYYSADEIEEASTSLFDSVPRPVNRAKDYRSMKKNLTILNIMYDCINSIPHQELPVFVCKDLNNIPQFKDNKKDMRDEEEIGSIIGETGEEMIDFDENTINEICRNEQKQMKTKISEMMAIIEELKSGLQRFLNVPEHSKVDVESTLRKIKQEKSEEIDGEDFSNSASSLALIQKYIDEDVEEEISIIEQENMDDSLCSNYDIILEEIESSECGVLEDDKQPGNNLKLEVEDEDDPEDDSSGLLCHQVISISEDLDSSPKAHMEDRKSATSVLEGKEESTFEISAPSINEREGKGTPQPVRFDLRSCAPEKCPICDISFSSKSRYDQHAKSHYKKGTYDCALCNQCFTSREELVEHFIQCFKEVKNFCNLEEHTCSVCGSFYADQTSLAKHKALHSECRRFQCSKCTFRYFSKKGLSLHMKNQHNPLNKYLCPLCNLSFLCNSFLNIHIAVHTGARPFSCCTCDHRTDSKKAIKQHLYTHSKNYVKKLRCNECCFTCEGSYLLLKHRLLQHREPVRCPICAKSFKNPSSYRRHYETHKGKNKFKCHLCTYSSTFKRYLEKHTLSHSSSMGFCCPNCNVPLSSKHTVGHHVRKYCIKRPSVV